MSEDYQDADLVPPLFIPGLDSAMGELCGDLVAEAGRACAAFDLHAGDCTSADVGVILTLNLANGKKRTFTTQGTLRPPTGSDRLVGP